MPLAQHAYASVSGTRDSPKDRLAPFPARRASRTSPNRLLIRTITRQSRRLRPLGTLIHTAHATSIDEVWLWCTNSDTTDRKLTVEFGGVASPDDTVEITIPLEDGPYLVIPGWTLTNSLTQKLVFDVGMHKGFDTEFYLRKGFRVVAVEAAPYLCKAVAERLADYVKRGQLTIVNRAIAPADVKTINFYLNPRKEDWGSTSRHSAEKGVDTAVEITIETTTLGALIDQYGVPYYLKSDIEGADPLLVSQLMADSRRPTFVSIETYSVDDLNDIAACGFERFQIVNQWMHTFVTPPKPPREGLDIDAAFNGETSGLFGRDLAPERWINIEDCRRRFGLWRELHDLDENLAPGWCDIHACNLPALQT